ncbi:inhibitor of Bruton tyrosine kinase-like [Octopus vulgaris]|uniref:Inhibitor of Bruton tyrosine kinase-like n=1 Tax=Octopus vulgaris TaxID=6645 RepID=A0AA36BUN2_OCTVU|nr:inhibitor of Bruton tyrosine kinase-like [Octopus vulgaris]
MSFIRAECGLKCQSKQHASQLNAAITKGSFEEIKAYFQTCHVAGKQSDLDGNFPLHVAAGCGKLDVVQWLLDEKHVDVNAVDRESGWTALHKALFYGHLAVARLLIQHEASLEIQDREGLRPFNLQREDELTKKLKFPGAPNDVYVWGENHNSTLGLPIDKECPKPTILDTFQQQHITVKQVILCTYHTVFVSHCGRVYTCGHGGGGRLGLGNEKTYLTPQLVNSSKAEKYSAIAASVNHTVMITERGKVHTCGSNEHFQLGQKPVPANCLIPTLVCLKTSRVIGACTGQYHTVVYTHDAIYAVGFNGGQLGPLKGEHYQKQLYLLLDLVKLDQTVKCVESSDAATVCLSKNGHVYVFHEFLSRKITSDLNLATRITLTGGTLNLEHLNISSSSSNSSLFPNSHLVILIFCKSQKRVCIWWSNSPIIKYCRFGLCDFNVMDICLSKCNIGVVTTKGETYIGKWKKAQVTSKEKSPLKETRVPSKGSSLKKVMIEHLHMKRLPYVHRATHLAISHDEKNFVVTQADPFASLKDYTAQRNSRMISSFRELLDDSDDMSLIHDVQIKSGCKSWFAHRYILAHNSKYFQALILINSPKQIDDVQLISISYIHPDLINQILQFVYTNTCDLLTVGKQFIWSVEPHIHVSQCRFCRDNQMIQTESTDPIELLVHLAKKLELNELVQRLDNVCLYENKVYFKKKVRKLSFSEPKFDRSAFSVLSDVTIKCSDSKDQFKCHKCILVARSEYFRSMFSCVWRETSTSTLTLSFPADVLEIFLWYLYSNNIPNLNDCILLQEILAKAEETLLVDLKHLCEIQLIRAINMNNIFDLLRFAMIYSAENLQKTCLQGICDNITHFLELRLLDPVEEEVMYEISKFYKENLKSVKHRVITPFSEGPDRQYLEQLAKDFSSSKQVTPKPQATPVIKNKIGRRRSRHKSFSFSELKTPEAVHNNGSPLKDSLVNNNNDENGDDDNNNANNNNNNNSKYDNNNVEHMQNEAGALNHSFTESTSCQKPAAARDKDNPWSLILSPVKVPDKSQTGSTRTGSTRTGSTRTGSTRTPPQPLPHPPPQTVISLTNIMAEQQSQLPQQKEVKSRCQNLKAAKSGSHENNKNTFSWGLTSCRKQKLSEGSSSMEATSPTSPPPPPVISPWQIKKAQVKSDANLQLADIVKDEIEKSQNLSRTRNKTLHYIQIEEKAITDLMAYYLDQVSFDETISVEREYVHIEQPSWNVNRKLRYNETLLSSLPHS